MQTRLTLRLAFCLLFLIAPAFIPHPTSLIPVTACVPIDRSFYGYSFLNMNILQEEHRQALAPLFMRFDKMYEDYFQTVAKANQDDNLAEWGKRFCGQVTPEDLAYVIYKSPVDELDQLLTAIRSTSLVPPPSLQDNTFADFVFEKKCAETVGYLIFSKRCEPHVTVNDQWKAPERDRETMQALIEAGKELFRQTKSHYIRLRYAYQIIRLAHYRKDYEQTLKLCNELLPQVDKTKSRWAESIVPWWIEGHKAGALRRLGKNVEASYRYAQIFDKCPGRRASAYQSFYIKTDEEWAACLRMCKSDAERATMYSLRAAGAESRAVEDMEKIYELDPRSPLLEVLLVQEIRKMERNLLGYEFNPKRESNKRRYDVPKKYAATYVINLQKFARQVRREGKTARPALWRIAEGYLEMLAGDYYAAEKTFHEAGAEVQDTTLKTQLDVLQLALKIAAFDKPSNEVEEAAYRIIQDEKLYARYKSFPDFLQDKMAYLFRKYHQEGMAYLSQHPLEDLKPNPTLELLDDLIAAALKPDQTNFERLLILKNPVNTLLDLKAVHLMSTGQMEAAFESYKRIPAEQWDDFGRYEPFKETFKDCVNCFPRPDTGIVVTSMNRGELIEALLDIEYKSRGDLEGAARHYYRLGLAYYNISYFGYAWRAADHFRSGSTWSKLHKGNAGIYDHWKYPIGNRENTDLSSALYCFEKARSLATDSELAAKATFQAARCEQKMYFMTPDYKPEPCCNRIPRLPEEWQVNLSRLKEQYAETAFYGQIIKECKYFERYVGR